MRFLSVFHNTSACYSMKLFHVTAPRRSFANSHVQAQAIPPVQLSSSPPGMPQVGLQSIMDVPLLRVAPGFLAEMDTALHLPRVSKLYMVSGY